MPADPSPDIALADEIVAALNARHAGVFVAERTWVPDWDTTQEASSLQVAVQPSPEPSGELLERDHGLWEVWPIDIAFAQRITAHTRDQIDGLLHLVDDCREFLQLTGIVLDDGRQFQGLGFEFLVRFDPTLLKRQKVGDAVKYAGSFLSVFRVPFQRLQ